MNQNLKYSGQWFLPNSNERVFGTLTFENNIGCRLELMGELNGENANFTDIPIILGVTSDSKQITLVDNFLLSRGGSTLRQYHEIGTPLNIYAINNILEGAHFFSVDELMFNSLNAELYNLDEWLGISGFDTKKLDSDDLSKVNINYNLPDNINFIINPKLKGSFTFHIKHPTIYAYQKDISVKQSIRFVLQNEEKQTLADILYQLFIFQQLLVISLYKETYPIAIELFTDKKMTESESSKHSKIILYKSYSKKNIDFRIKNSWNMLINYQDIKDTFPKIIETWYEKYENVKPAIQLVVQQFFNSTFNENTFLNLAQAAETFHSRFYDHERIPKKDYNKMKEDILDVVKEPSYVFWLKNQFQFGNNLTLNDRLTELLVKYSTEFLDKAIGDKANFVQIVKENRNYLTHYNKNKESKALKVFDLHKLSEQLKLLLVSAFFIEIGIEKSILEKKILETGYLNFRV
ncbi:ApeA N-terminal domain 1-containing protein [Dyadobacter frigoris]|uniref:Uncharacterized protein n=1 Tax=Dyadobacter frigoris TaxID=2576211 RepID=A0A4U6D799_9BACT|nr:HEPN domain-containing protein [Dyadobacter frigoris]TKT92008.1 hypothetical protein FDK13_12785 [Dyadobacter frigoris]GLU53113.1 hypothetical protein Dfri01_25740 [Dyadobacter frigoris]